MKKTRDDIGSGLPVVLVHGHPFNRTMWAPQVEFLKSRYRVITPDLRGYGEYAHEAEKTRLETFATDILELLDELGVDRFVLGGLSMGGQIALELYRQARERITALILADTSAQLDKPEQKQLRYTTADRLMREGIEAYALEVLPKMITPRHIETMPAVAAHVLRMMQTTPPAGAAAALRGRAERVDYTPLLADIRVPALIVVGDQDAYTPVADALYMYERIGGAELVVIDDAGHMPNLEQPAAFNDAMGRFVDAAAAREAQESVPMKIGFVGLGAMGFPMARHLAKEHEVLVWNRTHEKAARHAREHGSTVVSELAEITAADVIITMLPTSAEVDEIVNALLPSLRAGTLFIDATSGDPNASRVTAQRLAGRGVEFVDAPVTGAIVGAENATLTIMIGGTAEGFERAKDVLRLCGKTIIHVGPAGSGHAIKVLTNSVMGATVWITSECLLLAKQLGIDPKTALAVTNAGSGRSNASENLLPMRLVEGKWPLVFRLAHHDKDIRIASRLAHQQHASTPMLALTSQLFTAALHELGPEADYVEVAKIVARMNGASWDV